jgi:thymidylate synthase (FAD)
MKIVKPSVELLWITPNALQQIELAGRTAYKSEDKINEGSAEKFIKLIMSKEHRSVLEHASASIRFICDRGVTHEMVRHRIASYTQESTRYCNYSKDKFDNEITFIDPADAFNWDRYTCRLYAIWEHSMEQAQINYLEMIAYGATPQEARDVLPNSLKTEIVMTANFREWLHFFELRCAQTAHPQMREVANMAKGLLIKECPTIFFNQGN